MNVFFMMSLLILLVVIHGAKPSGRRRSARLHMLRMHPFLKHRILSKSMRDLVYNSKMSPARPKRSVNATGPAKRQSEGSGGAECSGGASPAAAAAKEENGMLLDKVLRDLEDLKRGKNLEIDSECTVSGNWFAEIAGREIKIKKQECRTHQKIVKMRRPLQRRRRGFMGNRKWVAALRFPFKSKSNIIILQAYNMVDHIVAVFMGECRVCRTHEIIQGEWLISRHSRDCEGLGSSANLMGDVWRRDRVDEKKECRMESAGKVSKCCHHTNDGPA